VAEPHDTSVIVRDAATLIDARSATTNDDVLLVRPLLVLTVVTGLIDAISFLGLGGIFTANMTGNVVFLAFALAGATGLSAERSAAALFVFGLGSLLAGRVANLSSRTSANLLLVAMKAECSLLGLAAGVTVFAPADLPPVATYAVIVCTAFAMGLRNAIVRKLAVPDLTTTVLTLTITGVAADSSLAAGRGVRAGRKVLSILMMLGGALGGALLLRAFGVGVPLAVAALLVGVSAMSLYSRSRARGSDGS
jgi:uncharacterized membrane protein YoaK (UPF0700 family)